MKIFCILLLIVAESSQDFFLAHKFKEDNSFCVTNTSNALSFIVDDIDEKLYNKSQYIPQFKNFENFNLNIENDDETRKHLNSSWTIQNSLNFKYGPIFDERWEDFPIFKTNFIDSNNTKDELKFQQVLHLEKNYFQIPISIRIEEEAHIFLCDGNNVVKSKCYWLLLQAFEKTATVLRKCGKSSIPTKNGVYPQPLCSERQIERKHPNFPYFLTNKQWNHFILEKQQNIISFQRISNNQKTIIIGWQDYNPIDITHILIHSKNVNGLWKLHTYYFLYTTKANIDLDLNISIYPYQNSVCLSMYILMCSDCKIKLSLVQQNVIVREETFEMKNSEWTKIRFIVENLPYKNYKILISNIGSDSNQFWSIDKIRQCQIEEYRSTESSVEAECQLISNENSQVAKYLNTTKTTESNSCPENTIGDFCMNCTFLFKDCNNVKICNKNECFCSAGYQGDNCIKYCNDKFYGHGCKMKCEKCNDICESISGLCHNEQCLDNYSGPKCNIPPDVMFKNPPSVTNISFTTSTVLVSNFDTENFKNELPQNYYFQFKKSDETNWNITAQSIPFNLSSPILLNNLQPDTEYLVRAVIYTNTEQLNDRLQITKFTTNCQEVSENEIKVETTNTTASILILRDSDRTCRYQTKLKAVEQEIQDIDGSIFKNLKPYTNYTLQIFGRNNFEKTFQTEEGVPSEILNLREINKSSNSIELQWTQPEFMNGIFVHYIVEYQFISSKACENHTKPTQKNNLTTIETIIQIQNLNPFAKYQIWISVRNNKFEGKAKSIILETEASESFYPDEIPKIDEIQTSHFNANIVFSKVDCGKKRGPIVANLTLFCKSDWCLEEIPVTIRTDFSQKNVSFTNLKVYSKYELEITYCRKNGKCVNRDLKTFQTKATVPNQVTDLIIYSKNFSSISLRWKPPYPPTGVLNNYKIAYYYNNNLENFEAKKTFKPFSCELWSFLHCITLNNLESDTDYTIEINAQNENPTEFGKSTQIKTYSRIEKSEKPYDLKIDWSYENNLNLEWKHPNQSNGNIVSFGINISDNNGTTEPIEKSLYVNETTYNLTYFYQIDSSEFKPTVSYLIKVWANNGLIGNVASLQTISPPDIPQLSSDPSFQSSNNSIAVSLHFRKIRGQSDHSQLLVLRSGGSSNLNLYPKLQKYNFANLQVVLDCNEIGNELDFVLGNQKENKNCQKLNNTMLQPSKTYNITIILINSFGEQTRETIYSYSYITEESVHSEHNSSLFGLFALFIIVPLIIVVYLKRKTILQIKNNLFQQDSNTSREVLEIQMNSIPLLQVDDKIEKKIKQVFKVIHSKLVKLDEFENYVKEAIENGELKEQYSLFPRGETRPSNYGSLPENKAKNRYQNIVAYDHSRVILEKLENEPHSDYINANYVHGYNMPNAYIATQGPKVSTVGDFWRMIWQENVQNIIMLANIYEKTKKKLEKYWPDINETFEYNKIKIRLVSSTIYEDYEQRYFSVSYQSEIRKIQQLHFISWPDHGVPLYSQSLASFLQKMLEIPVNSKSPIVVHCSAGVGRTGTILLCNICIQMAEQKREIDVLKNLQLLREQRVNMVDNFEQYKLAHLVILEYLTGLKTSFACHDLRENLFSKENLLMQMKYLEETRWQDQAMQTIASKGEEVFIVKEKNRFEEIIPEIQGRVFLAPFPVSDATSSYINAVKVDGFRAPGRFIVTQQPLPNTLGDFWRLIDQYSNNQTVMIVSLNEINHKDKTSCQFWPTDSQFKPVSYLTIKHIKTESFDCYNIITLHLSSKSRNDHLQIEILEFKDWKTQFPTPKRIQDFLIFWEQTNLMGCSSNPIFITCYDGVTASGLYLALFFLIEKMKLEQICDVCQSVRTVRHNLPQFVQDLEQYEFLYKAAMIYLDSFECYANFR